MSNTLINVSNRLPVTVEGDKIAKSAGGLVAALDGLSKEQYTTKWIGWPGAAFAETSREREIERVLTEEYGCCHLIRFRNRGCCRFEPFMFSVRYT
jgi:trehalose-6-phosphate synthase